MDELADIRAYFFDLNSPTQFFRSLCRTAAYLQNNKIKETDRLVYLLMGLVHLREWIAPGYNHKKPASSPAEEFYNAIYRIESFKQMQGLCNRSKHMTAFNNLTEAEYHSTIDDWPDFDNVANFDLGPPTGYLIDGKNLLIIIDEVIEFYDANWFAKFCRSAQAAGGADA